MIRGRRRRPVLRALVIVVASLVAVTLGWVVWATVVFVLPRQQPLHPADAVVALSPPSGRLPAAQAAFADGIAPRLWVSYVPRDFARMPVESDIRAVCSPDSPDAARTTCFAPLSDDTIGEARAVARLVQETGATSVVVATDRSHAARASFLFRRCLPAGTEVQMLLVAEPPGFWRMVGRMFYETGAYAKAVVDSAEC